MEISLNNIGVRRETFDAGAENVGHKAVDASRAVHSESNLEITSGISGFTSAEPVAEVPESALVRNDALGNLVSSAFNLAAPQMPDFVD